LGIENRRQILLNMIKRSRNRRALSPIRVSRFTTELLLYSHEGLLIQCPSLTLLSSCFICIIMGMSHDIPLISNYTNFLYSISSRFNLVIISSNAVGVENNLHLLDPTLGSKMNQLFLHETHVGQHSLQKNFLNIFFYVMFT